MSQLLAADDYWCPDEGDLSLAQRLLLMVAESDLALLAAMALVSRGLSLGHSCMELQQLAALAWLDDELVALDVAGWQQRLLLSQLVSEGERDAPLRLQDGRLYWQRFWRYECQVATALLQLSQRGHVYDATELQAVLDQLYPQRQPVAQVAAVVNSLCADLAVICGGPGTGKTTTVVKVLLALQQLVDSERPLRMAITAPTGKAAARLQQAVTGACEGLPESVAALIPCQAQTLHRLLRRHPTSGRPFYHRERPLPLDVLVVDECSMVDIGLFAQLLEALPLGCRLILLGDRDQLASVQAGDVFASLCQAHSRGVSAERGAWLQQLGIALEGQGVMSPLAECVSWLQHNFRSAESPQIVELAAAVQQQDLTAVYQQLAQPGSQLVYCDYAAVDFESVFLRQVADYWVEMFKALQVPRQALACFNQARVLVVQRHGALGVARINQLIEQHFRQLGWVTEGDDFYPGRPIQILQNDYGVQLYNGDIGVILPREGRLYGYFERDNGEAYWLPLARLPRHETAYAMTVHKSQGSEFEQVMLLLPDQAKRWLSSSLLYTGMTRARRQVVLWSSQESLRAVVSQQSPRFSGLAQRLK